MTAQCQITCSKFANLKRKNCNETDLLMIIFECKKVRKYQPCAVILARLYPFTQCDLTARIGVFQEFFHVLGLQCIVETCKKYSVFRICRLEGIRITISNG